MAASAAMLLLAPPGKAADASQLLANTCQSAAAPKTRLAACESLLHEAGLTPKLTAPVNYAAAMAHVDLQDPDNALINLNAALTQDPGFWPASWVRADLRQNRRDYAGAVQDWSQVLAAQPTLIDAYARRAAAADGLGHAAEAIDDYTKAIAAASPSDPIARFYASRAIADTAAGRYDAAIADADESIKRADGDDRSYAGRGRAHYLKGDAVASARDFRKAVELDPASIYNALWLYLAETEAGDDGADGLRGRVGQLPLAQWPGPIVRVILGDAKPDEIQAKSAGPASWSPGDRQAGADCERAFFLGEFYRLHGQKDRAAASFRTALATHMWDYVEYAAAEAELKQVGP